MVRRLITLLSKKIFILILVASTLVVSLAIFSLSQFTKKAAPHSNKDAQNNQGSNRKPLGSSRESTGSAKDLLNVARNYGIKDPLAGITYADSLSAAEKEAFLAALFEAWASHDPAAASGFITASWEIGFDENRELPYESIFYSVVEIWSKTDPLAALGMLMQQVELSESADLSYKLGLFLDTAIVQWSQKEPALAFEWLITQNPQDLQNRAKLIESIVEEWAILDPLEVLSRASLFEGFQADQNSLYNTALTVWSNQDALSAANWYDENLASKPKDGLTKAAEQIGQNLFSQLSGEDALRWIDSLSHEESKQDSLGSLTFAWTASSEGLDILETFKAQAAINPEEYVTHLGAAAQQLAISQPEALTEWLNAQEHLNAATDAVISSTVLVLSQTHGDYELAAEWSQQIQNTDERWFAQELLLSSWISVDRVKLNEWIEQNGDSLPEHIRSQF